MKYRPDGGVKLFSRGRKPPVVCVELNLAPKGRKRMDEESEINSDAMESQKLADNAMPLCPNCFSECDPKDNYCPNCDSNEAINPLASYMPFVDLRFRVGMIGKLWRKTWAPDTQTIDRCINIMLLMLFCPLILLIGLPILIYEKIKAGKSPIVQQDAE